MTSDLHVALRMLIMSAAFRLRAQYGDSHIHTTYSNINYSTSYKLVRQAHDMVGPRVGTSPLRENLF